MSKEKQYLFVGIIIVIIAVIAGFLFWQSHKNNSQTSLVSIFNISAPNGWKKLSPAVSPADQPATSQTIDFEKISTSTDSNRIERAIEVDFENYKNSIGSSLNGAGLYSSFVPTQTWNVINGYVILGIIRPAQVIYTVVVPNENYDYTYSFSLTSAQANLPGLSNTPVDPADVKTLQGMVQNFAESLPKILLQ
jgi:hypothetical protein